MKWWFGKKKSVDFQSSGCLSFRERVDQFWEWWTGEADRIYESVDADGGATIQPEISQKTSELYPDIGWVFGPGADGNGHSFTLTPEGCRLKRYFVNHWFEKRSELKGWTFYPYRQPSTCFGEFGITIDGVNIDAKSLWITPKVDLEHQEIDLTAWTPVFAEISEESALTFLYLLLDQALGEEKTTRCIGLVELGDGKLDAAMPVNELPEFVDQTFSGNEWNTGLLGQVYQIEQYQGDFPRGDIVIGSTNAMRLVREYNKNYEPFEHSSTRAGGGFSFFQLPNTVLPDSDAVHFRGEIEDELDQKLNPLEAGEIIGGAMGRDTFYIDYVYFDEERATRGIDEWMRNRGWSDQYQVFPFTR